MNRKKSMTTWKGDLLLLITAIVWGGGFIGVSKALDVITPFYMIAMRFSIASILMITIFWKRFRTVKKSDLLPGCLIGVFLFIAFVFQTIGAAHLSVGKLSFLTALNVIIVPFISLLIFKERIKKYNWIASGIAVVGFAFLNLSAEMGISLGLGEVLGICCAIGFAAHIGVLGHFANKMDAIVLAILQMITCAILGLICAVLFEAPPQSLGMEVMMPVLYLGIFSTFIAFLCQSVGQKYTSASRAAIILCMESVFGTLFSVILLSERLTGSMMIGAGLILVAVMTAEYLHAKEEQASPVSNMSQ